MTPRTVPDSNEPLPPHPAGHPDPSLPVLTAEQADRLRSLAVTCLDDRGIRVTVDGAVLRGPSRVLSLESLARRCSTAESDQWPALVDAHISTLAGTESGPGPAEDVLRGAYLRLVPDDFLPAEAAAAFSYAQPVADGLLEAIALDTPDAVRLLDDKDVTAIGLEALRSAARANLVNEPVDRETVCHDGALIHLIAGDSFFVASKALVLPELLRTYVGQGPPADGVLLTVPSRHRLAFHLIVDEHAVSAVNALASFGLGAYQDAVGDGQLSPRLYWWHQDRLTSITHIDHETRQFSIQPPPELLAAMRRLSTPTN
ncbi:hypothetical protein [Streptomyces syringium]|uniref:Uncharacterized protein n=1 Tax=Streptomyces syringium TaxID=76729 RepID=A0ABS4XW11_9ACTN|nr:hypothetical protein [Streptomyces syringium]MBP2400705.1 hypothetical protein [Streptomyces syringium]